MLAFTRWITSLSINITCRLVLACICWITWGSYWVYDTPGAIQTQLETWFGGPDKYTKSMNLNLYSIYRCGPGFVSYCGQRVHTSYTQPMAELFPSPEQNCLPNYSQLHRVSLLSSYPNIVLAFLGGFLIDRVLGIRLSGVLFCGLIFLGQVLFAIGIQSRMYYLCLLGRFVFGLGGESLAVSQVCLTASSSFVDNNAVREYW